MRVASGSGAISSPNLKLTIPILILMEPSGTLVIKMAPLPFATGMRHPGKRTYIELN